MIHLSKKGTRWYTAVTSGKNGKILMTGEPNGFSSRSIALRNIIAVFEQRRVTPNSTVNDFIVVQDNVSNNYISCRLSRPYIWTTFYKSALSKPYIPAIKKVPKKTWKPKSFK